MDMNTLHVKDDGRQLLQHCQEDVADMCTVDKHRSYPREMDGQWELQDRDKNWDEPVVVEAVDAEGWHWG